ncbi:MAG TPA: gamma-glutamyl-gamma-aminobutyrate hydrolase family protein [Terriglobales bacterium]|nr:gamma-glutamyl-gamma-aminobutyrate hydrolase family protein [Terriglobales bacterium]
MSHADTQQKPADRPRVGIPWRTTTEQREQKRDKLDYYFEAVRKAGADPQEISLNQTPEDLDRQLKDLDGFVLPGSPADVDPARYGAPRLAKTKSLDANRDNTDTRILEHAFASGKPVLAICYGCQNLNVVLGGTLYQDIPTELHTDIVHSRDGLAPKAPDPQHAARIEPGGELGQLAAGAGLPKRDGGFAAQVNTSHHQSIRKLGHGLRVAAVAPDGVIEAVEHGPHKHWVVGVQWHPERMAGDALSESLFRALVQATRAAVVHKT